MGTTERTTEISILIPTYNEAEIISFAIQEISKEFSEEERRTIEILVVDDGTDSLPEIVNSTSGDLGFQRIQVFRNSPPLGKGKSLALGFQESKGSVVGFLDVDLSTPTSYLKRAIQAVRSDGTDVFIGSRYVAGSVVEREQFFVKDILGKILGMIARYLIFFGMRNYRDTQCGFKFYKNHIAKTLYHKLLANDGLNDLEVLIRANLLGFRIEECGVVWSDLRESKRLLRRILWGELVAVAKIVLYYKIFPSAQLTGLKEFYAQKSQRKEALN